jgi:hypothetical protein
MTNTTRGVRGQGEDPNPTESGGRGAIKNRIPVVVSDEDLAVDPFLRDIAVNNRPAGATKARGRLARG